MAKGPGFCYKWLTEASDGRRKPMEEKDMALLDSSRSSTWVDSITERIARLKREIGRGDAVYTAAELEKLQRQLDDYEEMFRVLNQC
jgi:uncharacterized small protein (DUF1192 family)